MNNFIEESAPISEEVWNNLDYIPTNLLNKVQNYIVPDYAKEENGTIIKSVNNKIIGIGDTVFFKEKNVELIIKTIEQYDDEFLITCHDGTEFITENYIAGVYKNSELKVVKDLKGYIDSVEKYIPINQRRIIVNTCL